MNAASTAPARSASSAGPAPRGPNEVEVLDVPLAAIDYQRTMDWMDAMVRDGRRGTICVATVHIVMRAREDHELRDAMLGSALIVPDGQPLVWALRALGHREATRVYGPELMARYCERSARSGATMYLYGGRNQGALVELALGLRRRHPGLKIVGGHSPPFRPLTDDERDFVVEDINRSKADVVWVGTGQPKQEIWMREMRPLLDAPMLIGVGAAFDFHAGLVPQAPTWMQDVGLEWVFRLSKEPRRLWRRYARYNPRFVAGFARQYAHARRR